MVTRLVKSWIRGDDDDDIEEGENAWIVYAGMALLALMCASLFKSCQEFRYAFKGQTILATIREAQQYIDDDGDVSYTLVCDFHEPGSKKVLTIKVPASADEGENYAAGDKVAIQYLGSGSGNFTSRLQGTHEYFWVALFFTFLAVLGGGFVWGCIHWSRVDAADKRGRRK